LAGDTGAPNVEQCCTRGGSRCRTLFSQHYNGRELEPDTEGLEFPSLEAAYLGSLQGDHRALGELLARREDPRRLAFEICDTVGNQLLKLPFAEILQSPEVGGTKPPTAGAGELRHQLDRMNRLALDLSSQVEVTRGALLRSKTLLNKARRD
jgi:hypothetical protein